MYNKIILNENDGRMTIVCKPLAHLWRDVLFYLKTTNVNINWCLLGTFGSYFLQEKNINKENRSKVFMKTFNYVLSASWWWTNMIFGVMFSYILSASLWWKNMIFGVMFSYFLSASWWFDGPLGISGKCESRIYISRI